MSDLIDRQALKDAVRRYADEPIKAKDKKCQAICLDMLGTIDAQPAASPWHRVEEPPKEEGKYLVYDGRGNYFVAWWGPRLGWCYDPKFFCYWMPIEPPKEGEE